MALSLYYLSSFSFSGFDPLGGISVLKDKETSSPLGLPTQNQEPCPKETVIASSKIQPASHFSKMEQQRDMAERTILPASTGGSQGSTIINTVPKQVAAKVFSFSNCSDDITPRVVLPSLDHTIISSSMKPAEWEEMRLPPILPASTGGSQGSTTVKAVPKQVAAKIFSFSNCSDDITPRVVLPSLDHTIISSSMQPAEWEEMRLPQENEIFDLLESVYGASCIPSTTKEERSPVPQNRSFSEEPLRASESISTSSDPFQVVAKPSIGKKRKALEKIPSLDPQTDVADNNNQCKELDDAGTKRQRPSNEQTDTINQPVEDIESESSIPQWLFTENGKRIVNYFSDIMESGRGNEYFTKKFRLEDIHFDYMAWCMDKSPFSEQDFPIVNALLSRFANVISLKFSKLGTIEWHVMKSKEKCITQIRLMKQAIDKNL